ncbi:MAG TPA: response regulator [Polyangiales bacterium]|nr:response regulator [Polyangiales bacterium]
MAQAANSALFSARLRFVEGLPARAHELSSTAERLARDPHDPEAANVLRRRLHALLASAQVFEEPALSLAVQDLIARLDLAQQSQRPFTSEEIDAVIVVVASLPTYVRPTSLPPPAAYSDVRELRKEEEAVVHELPLPPAAAAENDPILIDLPAGQPDDYTPPVLALGVPRSSAADLRPPPVELSIDVELPPSDAERLAIAELDRALGIEPEDGDRPTLAGDPQLLRSLMEQSRPPRSGDSRPLLQTDRPLLGDSHAPLELPEDEVDVLIDWTALSQGTAESLPPIEPQSFESGVHSATYETTDRPADRVALLPALEPRSLSLPEGVEEDTTDPGLGPPVLLEQTVSGLLPTPQPALVLLCGALEQAPFGRAAEEVPLGCDAELGAGLSPAAAGIELLHAASPDEAVRVLHERSPDLVLISAELANQPGADLVRRLKSDPLTPAASVHLLLPETASDEQPVIDQLGADGVLRLPLTAAALEPLLERAGERRRFGLREGSVDDIAAQIAEEIRRGIAESLREGKQERMRVGDGSELMAAAWSAIGRVRSHLAEQQRERVRLRSDERSSLQPSAAAAAHPAQLLAGCRVLVADDDPAVLWFFVGLLREASATVFQAHNGREALELARRKQPHVIVSDILMPKLDGFGLCRELKRDALLARVPVVLLSWKDDLLQRMRELDAGAAGYLRKEAGSPQILNVVQEVLEPRTRLAAQLRAPGEVRGTLEDFNAWVLLELIAAFRPDAHLVVRDAWSIFEVEVRSGRRLAVTRTAADGSFTRGDKALMQLLGLGMAEFEVSTSSASLRTALSEPLDRALVAAGRRLSALIDAVSDARLLRVSLIAFDDEVLQSLSQGASEQMNEIVALFRTGNATAESVLRDGKFAAEELERDLRQLARVLAITGVWSADGEDLVAAAQKERETPQLTLLTSSVPPRREVGDRDTPVVPIVPVKFERADATLVGIGRSTEDSSPTPEPEPAPVAVSVEVDDQARKSEVVVARGALLNADSTAAVGDDEQLATRPVGSKTVRGLGPPSVPPAEPEADLDAVGSDEGEAFSRPLPSRLDRSEGLRLTATLFVLAAVGYFGWQQLTLRKPNELRPAPLQTTIEAATAPVEKVSSPTPAPAEPALPNTQLGRILPFVDNSRGVEVAEDQGLLVLEYHGTDPAPTVRVGERELGKPPLAVALPVGRHELVVRAGKSTSFRYLIVRAGETRIVSLPLAEL